MKTKPNACVSLIRLSVPYICHALAQIFVAKYHFNVLAFFPRFPKISSCLGSIMTRPPEHILSTRTMKMLLQ